MKKEMLLDGTGEDNLSSAKDVQDSNCPQMLRDILLCKSYSEEQFMQEFEIAKKDIWADILLAYYNDKNSIECKYNITHKVANRLKQYFIELGITFETTCDGEGVLQGQYDKVMYLCTCSWNDFSDNVKLLPEYEEALQKIWGMNGVPIRTHDKQSFEKSVWLSIVYYKMNNKNSFVTVWPKSYSQKSIELLTAHFKRDGIKVKTFDTSYGRSKVMFSWDTIDVKGDRYHLYSKFNRELTDRYNYVIEDISNYITLSNAFGIEPKELLLKRNFPLGIASFIEQWFSNIGIDVTHYITKFGNVALKISYRPEFDLSKYLESNASQKEFYVEACARKCNFLDSILRKEECYKEKGDTICSYLEKVVYNQYLSKYGIKVDIEESYRYNRYRYYYFTYEKDISEIIKLFDINEEFPDLVESNQYEYVYEECKNALLNEVHKSRSFEHCLSNESIKYVLENKSIMRKLSIEFYLEGVNAVLRLTDQPKILFDW